MIIVNGWSSPHQDNLESVRCVFNPMHCPKVSLKWSLSCLLLLIQSFWSSTEFQTDPKHCFLILADQVCAPQKFLGNVSALCWVVLCSMAGALSHALAEAIWARPAWACTRFTVCQSPVTPEHRRSKSPAAPTTTQLLHLPTSFSAPLLLLSAHVFLRLTTNPPFMCIIGSPALTGVTALESLSRVVLLCLSHCYPLWFVQLLVSLSDRLLLFVCFALTVKRRKEKRSMRRRLVRSHLAKP